LSAPDSVSHSFTYDGSLLLSHTLAGPVAGVVAWTFDNDFRLTGQSINGANTVTFAYDADSLLTQAGALLLNRNAQNGLLTGTTLDGVSDTWSYNSHGEPLDYHASVGANTLYRAQFTRDALGRITQKVETINGATDTYTYAYDLAGRLSGANRNTTSIAYGYDANSNRVSYSGPLGNVAGATYDAQDRLVQYGPTTYAYNNNGDLATRTQGANTTQFTYDEFGNLTRVLLPGGTQIDYVIDALNRRIGKKVNGAMVKRWLYDGQLRVAAELNGSGAGTPPIVEAHKQQLTA
jgi:YD repeat-containing protein